MSQNKLIGPTQQGLWLTMTVVGLTLLLSILACSTNFSGNAPPQNATDVARSVESTINAEKVATMQAKETQNGIGIFVTKTESPGVNATIQAQQVTLNAQATNLAPQGTQPPATEISLASSTPASKAPLQSVSITNWSMYFWVPLSSGCKVIDIPCWKLADEWNKAQSSSGDGVMTSKEPVLIDSAWERPFLVFWNKRLLRRSGAVDIQLDGDWVGVKNLSDTRSEWAQEAIDLQPYKGKQLIIRFVSEIGYYQQSTWFIQDVKIVPNFKP